MRKFACVLFVCIVFCANARTLHVGDNTIKLSQTKTTDPALHVRIGDELWYGGMLPIFIQNTLHIRYNSINYSVFSCHPFTDTTNYTYDENGRLIAANENIYIIIDKQSSSIFNTGVKASLDIITQIMFKVKYSNGSQIFGASSGMDDTYNDKNIYRFVSYSGDRVVFQMWNININDSKTQHQLITGPQTLIPNVKYHYEMGNAYLKDISNDIMLAQGTPADSLNWEPDNFFVSNWNTVWLYGIKMYENDVLVRHFVPVPCGLKIGDFVVPSNGMWDIVEQKFYGNMGTGDFIYGVDE
ncbi:MAG: hypothetical protein ACLRFK_03535 [Alphaproteobacteria bacterium]